MNNYIFGYVHSLTQQVFCGRTTAHPGGAMKAPLRGEHSYPEMFFVGDKLRRYSYKGSAT